MDCFCILGGYGLWIVIVFYLNYSFSLYSVILLLSIEFIMAKVVNNFLKRHPELSPDTPLSELPNSLMKLAKN